MSSDKAHSISRLADNPIPCGYRHLMKSHVAIAGIERDYIADVAVNDHIGPRDHPLQTVVV